MKARALLAGCCIIVLLAFSGCRSTEQKEVPAEKETKKETVSAGASKNAVSSNSISGNTPAQSQNVKNQDVEINPGNNGGEGGGSPAEAAQEETNPGQETAGTTGGDSMQQCPYCGQWFSTAPDGDLWNPYDRHVLEERDSSQSEAPSYEGTEYGETADGEMVQCPDCGNWYEEGNVFRNHICEGRGEAEYEETADGEMVQCPDCGNWYEEGNVFRNHICEGR